MIGGLSMTKSWIALGVVLGLPVGFVICLLALAIEMSGDPDRVLRPPIVTPDTW